MGGGAYYIPMPKMVRVTLTGKLKPWVAAKDIILDVLRQMTVKGGVGKIVEYAGPGVATLSVPERATITNMGAELGATTSIFPSDSRHRDAKRFMYRWHPIRTRFTTKNTRSIWTIWFRWQLCRTCRTM